MNTWTTHLSGLLASLDYLVRNFFTLVRYAAPPLIPFLSFIALFLMERYLFSFLSLSLSALFLFHLVYQRSRDLPGWNLFSSTVLAVFSVIVALSALAFVSAVTLRLEWTIVALFFLTLAFMFLLFAYFFKSER